MDLFIRKELSLSTSSVLEDVAPHCLKLLTWLHACQEEMHSENRHLRLNQSAVESLLKAHLYLFECYDRFGESLADRCDSRGFFTGCATLEDRRKCIRELCTTIVNTRKGETHAPLLHLSYQTFAEIQPAWSGISDLDWSEIRQSDALSFNDFINPDLQQMRRLVKRIGRLSSLQDMQTALKRSMELIGYQVWMQLFKEPKDSDIHIDCYLMRHMICDTLTEGVSTACTGFLHNIFLFVSQPANEMRFWASMEHVHLAGSLIAYLIDHWNRHLPYFDIDEMQLTADAPVTAVAELPVNEATYITNLMLATGSICRRQFAQQLRAQLPANFWTALLELLNKVAFVFS
ncbi:uncharacterized protein LOC6550753 [Drosophila erecta]|uniref:Uncharacterized protein n=1 Tax=Drosophila erecta TaxID=7220 RepID=B3NTH3_DROER|nr:uncharacterized protein LOC6550753 [Drosophila erecta]EDV46977.1 uncharacterized protein Dere_GG17903 [Drosophila erecta]